MIFEKTLERLILRIIRRKLRGWFALEATLLDREGAITAEPTSPARTWPDPEKLLVRRELPLTLKMAPMLAPLLSSCIHQAKHAIHSLRDNPKQPKLTLEPGFLEAFEQQAHSLGIGAIGYARLPRRLIFQDKAVLFANAIVLTKEMDREKINQAPSVETFEMVFGTYDSLGKDVNALCDFLRQHGYNAQGGHPLEGLNLYPPLAAEANLGWHGRHGLLITPQFGPRQRIAVIYTDIQDLPFATENQHRWISDFCDKCGRCIRTCPGSAIREQPVVHASGLKTHIVREKCLPIFNSQQGCTVCIKECTFHRKDYAELKAKFDRK